ncbi:MAG: polysulfide reductase NrfD [Chloroflexi bacterium]|nr:polysulfide reductase NrfD [Chloroflexota bacterium]
MRTPTAEERLEERVFRPLVHTSLGWYLWTAFLIAIIAFGLFGYTNQLRRGLAVTGMRDTVIWGLYISNFVFFSGVSMAGTFISAILRITGAEWRRPLTRMAELTTVAALLMTALMPVVDMGRPDRVLYLLRYGRLESPLVWDIAVISTYLTASLIYLYLFVIPDSAVVRERLRGKVSRLRQGLYTLLALGWKGLPEQRKRLERSAGVMMLLVIPIGVATHSVVSWIFGMTYRAGWNSTIFAPYFAVGALYSGTAMLITIMFLMRRVYHLEEYFTEKHFRYLGYMLVAFGLLYFYFTFAEYLTIGYKLQSEDKLLLQELLFGRYSFLVWLGFIGGQVVPLLLAVRRRTQTIPLLFVASLLVNIGMWVKRYVIVVPSLANPLMPYQWGFYTPTWVEMAVTAASFAGFALVFTLFSKLFPLISVWEMKEGWERAREVAVPSQAGLAARPARLDSDPGGPRHE